MSNWTKIISFREIEDDSRRLYDIWISWFGKGTWKRNNCGFIQVFSKKPGFEYWDDAVDKHEIELLFSLGPTDDNEYPGNFHLRDYFRSIQGGVQRAGFGDWWEQLYRNFIGKEFLKDKEMRRECAKWIVDNCAFRLFMVGRQSNLWSYCEPTEDPDIRIVPDSFCTYDPYLATDDGLSRPRRAKMKEIHPHYISKDGRWQYKDDTEA